MTPVRPLDSVARQRLEQSLKTLFRSFDPRDEPFTDVVPDRFLLYPYGLQLDRAEVHALRAGMEAVGDSTAFVTEVEAKEDEGEAAPAWSIHADDLEYLGEQAISVLDHVIVSPQAAWALLRSHEQHVLGAGIDSFVRAFRSRMPSLDDQARRFVSDWMLMGSKGSEDAGWVHGVLVHIFGETDASRFLAAPTHGN